MKIVAAGEHHTVAAFDHGLDQIFIRKIGHEHRCSSGLGERAGIPMGQAGGNVVELRPLAAFMVEVRISGGRLMAGLQGNVP